MYTKDYFLTLLIYVDETGTSEATIFKVKKN